ncbi:MAG: carboxynorspermidine decarboxylase [Myxococcales bacterium]|nr:carboxynorspermidine decarboxylase [Myxococcales bacterium]
MLKIDVRELETPCYVIDLGALRRNLEVLADVQRRAECKILLALKGFAAWSTFPIVREYLSGVTSSSPHEARLGREEFGREVHAYAPAYSDEDIREIAELCDHVVFNSFTQWKRLRPILEATGHTPSCGIRVNPEHSEVKVALYDPCAPGSRLGVRAAAFDEAALDGIEGLHFHTLCELGSDALERTLVAFEEKFGRYLGRMKWVNFGGGHHITRPGYDTDRLVRLVRDFQERHGVAVYLEPGEAIALNTGILVASVLDLVEGEVPIAILDTSATAHMPDVLEMPYRPPLEGGGDPGEKAHTYRLGGLTCLAGDVIGDWSFDQPLEIGSKLVFGDMAHYTMVKNTTFNGVRLPSIALHEPDTGELRVVRRFGYEDYKGRLS